MNNIERVYNAIKELTDHYVIIDNGITYAELEERTSIPRAELEKIITELYKRGKVCFHKSLPSTERDNYGEIMEFSGIKAL